MYVGKKQHLWNRWLHLIEFAFNTHIQSNIGVNAFYVSYGHECRTPIILSTPIMIFESINNMIRKMNDIKESIKLAIKCTYDRAKYYVDNKRNFREFEMGDKVFLKVAPNWFRLKLGKSRKLSPKFCGPFEIIKRLRQVTYELKLHENSRIHNVFHVELSRK